MQVDSSANADEPELQLITDAILAKSTSEQLLEIIQNGAIFVQAILNRTKLLTGPDGESQIIEQVVHVFKGSETEEDFDKVQKVLAKLCQINCVSNRSVIEWSCNSIARKPATVGYEDLVLEFNLIIQALNREASLKW